MKLLEKIGLVRSQEFILNLEAKEFQKRLIEFKERKRDWTKTISSREITPNSIKSISTEQVEIELWPLFGVGLLRPIGDISCFIVDEQDQTRIRAKFYSIYWWLIVIELMTLAIFSVGVLIGKMNWGTSLIWFLIAHIVVLIGYFYMRNDAKRLEQRFANLVGQLTK